MATPSLSRGPHDAFFRIQTMLRARKFGGGSNPMIHDASAHVRGLSSMCVHAIKRVQVEATRTPKPRKLTISAQAIITRPRNRLIGKQG